MLDLDAHIGSALVTRNYSAALAVGFGNRAAGRTPLVAGSFEAD